MKKAIKSITINKLQAEISRVIKEVSGGTVYQIMRYSEPAAVLLPSDAYEKLIDKINELQGECKSCINEFRKIKEGKK